MENSQPLSTESFSYSWLLHKSPDAAFDHDDDDVKVLKQKGTVISSSSSSSTRFLQESLNFDFPVSESSVVDLVHADEIFADGYMMPVYVDRPKMTMAGASTSSSVPATPVSSSFCSSRPRAKNDDNRGHPSGNFLKKWRKSSNRMLQRCCGYLIPVCHSLRCSRKTTKVDDLGTKYWEVQSWRSSSPQASSPRQSMVKSVDTSPQASPVRSSSADVNYYYADECPIYEAILHCKRSIEKRDDFHLPAES